MKSKFRAIAIKYGKDKEYSGILDEIGLSNDEYCNSLLKNIERFDNDTQKWEFWGEHTWIPYIICPLNKQFTFQAEPIYYEHANYINKNTGNTDGKFGFNTIEIIREG